MVAIAATEKQDPVSSNGLKVKLGIQFKELFDEIKLALPPAKPEIDSGQLPEKDDQICAPESE